jgi:hypothetical protein
MYVNNKLTRMGKNNVNSGIKREEYIYENTLLFTDDTIIHNKQDYKNI